MFNIKERAMLGMARPFINDEVFCTIFDKITEGVTPKEGEKVCLVVTKRLVMGATVPVMSVCTVEGMTLTGIHRQYTTDDLKKIVENV